MMFSLDRPAPIVTSLRAARRASRRVRARAGAAASPTVCIASGADASCSTPVGWKGDELKHSSLPLLPNGKPDYTSIDSQIHSKVLTATIRKLLIKEFGGKDNDSRPWTNFEALMTPVREVNDMVGTAADVQKRAQRVFMGILPELGIGWVPPIWKEAIQPNVPKWASNYAFYLVFSTLFPWLMGPIKGEDFVDVEVPPSLRKVFGFLPATVSLPQAIKAERCRFLETAQCASVCVNSCKVPSQEWLGADFAMPLHIQPNYEDYSCTWRFNTPPPPLEEDQAILVPCFQLCPSEFKGQKDAAKQVLQKKSLESLEGIASRASPEALRDAGVRAEAVSSGGKCWSIDPERLKAVQVMQDGDGPATAR